jgi:hypothetical protein
MKCNRDTMSILTIEEVVIGDEEYVYDVETSDRNYVCGTGNVVVKQSDSGYNRYAASADVKYGDSVLGFTPIMVRDPESCVIDFVEIQHLNEGTWDPYPQFKSDEPDRTNKQQSTTMYQAWDGESWTRIKRVIRHKVAKDIYEVTTDNGAVFVTEDHSLIDINMEYVKPVHLSTNTVLYSGYPDVGSGTISENFNWIPDEFELQVAYAYGVYYSCNMATINQPFNIVCDNADILGLCKSVFERLNTGIQFVVGNNTLRPVNNGNYAGPKYFAMFNNTIPDAIFRDTDKYVPFLCGIYQTGMCFTASNQMTASKMYYILKYVGADVYIRSLGHNYGYSLHVNSNDIPVTGNVRSFTKISTKVEFVYDIETSAGRFQAGVGSMIVKNTDSIYTLFKFPNQENIDKETLLEMNWDTAFECCERISNTFIKPIDLEMEKIMWPLYLYGKKRYTCKIYEKGRDPDGNTVFNSHNDYKGIQVVRRDNCNLVQTVSNPVLECLLDRNDINEAVNVVKDYIEKMFKNELDINEYVLSKSLKNKYPTENKNGRAMKPPGHYQLQQKMIAREVVNPPQAGDRIPFVYIEVDDNKATGGERMESPEYVIEHPDRCKIDIMFYLDKQLTSPMYTIFEVLVKNEDGVMFPRKVKVDKKTGKKTTEISKECKQAINELLFVDLVRKYAPVPNFMIKKTRRSVVGHT